jgi:methylmalonyl-CoA/ethylmalonyl-CoA epimerase
MKLSKISHIGIAVENLNTALAFYCDALGMAIEDIEVVEEQKVRVAFLPIGESRLEIMESIDPEGPVGKFVQKNGPGIHHMALEVDDVANGIETLKTNDIRMIDQAPRNGAGGAQIAFVHPKSTYGVLLEICSAHKA